jgi:hypothetical protein
MSAPTGPGRPRLALGRGRSGDLLGLDPFGLGEQAVGGGQDADPEQDRADRDVEREVDVDGQDHPAGRVRREPAADEPDEAVGRRRDRLLHRGDGHHRLGGDRVVDPDEDAGDDHGRVSAPRDPSSRSR